MARRWTSEEEGLYRKQLTDLYITQNMTIYEVAEVLGISWHAVFTRLVRLGIPTNRLGKLKANNKRGHIDLPPRSELLAEFFGIMLGDGHLAHFQTTVCLGTKEYDYVLYVQDLMTQLFGVEAHISTNKAGHHTVYIGSRQITEWLRREGLVANKVASQVDAPAWLYERPEYMRGFVRGFFDTDGSVYNLRFGIQISITNHSMPLLVALQSMLRQLGYRVSEISAGRIYITRKGDILRFFDEIAPRNGKHVIRFDKFARRWRSSKRTRL